MAGTPAASASAKPKAASLAAKAECGQGRKRKGNYELKVKGGRQSHFGQRGGSSPDRARSPCGQVWGQSVAAAAADDDDEVEVYSPRTLRRACLHLRR